MTEQTSAANESDAVEPPSPSFRSTLIRVLAVQLVAVAALWALQSAFDK